VTHSKLVVQSLTHSDRFSKVFSSLVDKGKHKGKHYEVAKATWPYASSAPGTGAGTSAVESEDGWWNG